METVWRHFGHLGGTLGASRRLPRRTCANTRDLVRKRCLQGPPGASGQLGRRPLSGLLGKSTLGPRKHEFRVGFGQIPQNGHCAPPLKDEVTHVTSPGVSAQETSEDNSTRRWAVRNRTTAADLKASPLPPAPLQAAGCWLLAAGCWLLAVSSQHSLLAVWLAGCQG